MLRDFNLLATTYRGFEKKACFELEYLLEKLGDADAGINRSGIAGLVAAKTVLDPFEVLKELRETLRDRPYEFRYILRLIPIEKVVRTDLNDITDATKELGLRIGENETFRITVEKRFTAMSKLEIIEAVAASIKRKVDLGKPDKVLLIEVVGGLTGLSLMGSDGILSVLKEKMI
ncbi:THUMP domain-containing protein [Candidatus Bathyarchaeota archaeon]|nr:THUMP domain-containing protein [Candidatus Bathyarchaeota archaeon]